MPSMPRICSVGFKRSYPPSTILYISTVICSTITTTQPCYTTRSSTSYWLWSCCCIRNKRDNQAYWRCAEDSERDIWRLVVFLKVWEEMKPGYLFWRRKPGVLKERWTIYVYISIIILYFLSMFSGRPTQVCLGAFAYSIRSRG
jgi:hypothetical protein